MNPIEALMETATPLQRKLLEGCRYAEETGCWEWVGNEYGRIRHCGVNYSIRKCVFNEFVGPLFDGDKLKMICSNVRCVCPTHAEISRQVTMGFWSHKTIKEKALKYKTLIDFSQNDSGAYNAARKLGILSTVTSHMKRQRVTKGSYTTESMLKTAKKFKTRQEFKINSPAVYCAALKSGEMNFICSHMESRGKWNHKKDIEKEAKKYSSRYEFQRLSQSAYNSAIRNGWLDDVCSHMLAPHKVSVKWTYDTSKIAASKCKGRHDFGKKYGRAYDLARKNGWLDEFFPKKPT